LLGSEVFNREREKLEKVEGFGIDPERRRLTYMVLFFGGFLCFGYKWFAVPWEAVEFSQYDQKFIPNVEGVLQRSLRIAPTTASLIGKSTKIMAGCPTGIKSKPELEASRHH
jgi:hypothetical protein